MHHAITHGDVERGLRTPGAPIRCDRGACKDRCVSEGAATFDTRGLLVEIDGRRAGEGEGRLAQASAHVECRRNSFERTFGAEGRGTNPQLASARVGHLCIEEDRLGRQSQIAGQAAGNARQKPIDGAVDIKLRVDATVRKLRAALGQQAAPLRIQRAQAHRAAADGDIGAGGHGLAGCCSGHFRAACVGVAARRQREVHDRLLNKHAARREAR